MYSLLEACWALFGVLPVHEESSASSASAVPKSPHTPFSEGSMPYIILRIPRWFQVYSLIQGVLGSLVYVSLHTSTFPSFRSCAAEAGCIVSTNFPDKYPNSDSCVIEIAAGNRRAAQGLIANWAPQTTRSEACIPKANSSKVPERPKP